MGTYISKAAGIAFFIAALLILCSTLLVPQEYSLSDKSPDTTLKSSGKVSRTDAPTDWHPEDYMDFHYFENVPINNGQSMAETYKRAVINAVLTTIDFLTTGVAVLEEEARKPRPDNVALLRYFPNAARSIYVQFSMIYRWLAVLGGPPYNDPDLRQQCMAPLGKLQIYYNVPPPGTVLETTQGCGNPGSLINELAYVFRASAGNNDGMVICQRFFDTYKRREDLDSSLFAPYYDLGYQDRTNEPTYMSAQMFLHELLHLDYLYRDIFNTGTPFTRIDDINIYDSGISRVWAGYRSWGAQRVTDWPWVYKKQDGVWDYVTRGYWEPMLNSDNWVYFMLENFLKEKYTHSDWQNSPDPRTGPHFPPNHPLAPAPPAPVSASVSQIHRLEDPANHEAQLPLATTSIASSPN